MFSAAWFYLGARGVIRSYDVAVPDTHTSAGGGHATASCGPNRHLHYMEQALAWTGRPDALQCIFDVSTLHCDVH
jgi:hypothetical protein